eukprot:5038994-Amphidinium_carterae.1
MQTLRIGAQCWSDTLVQIAGLQAGCIHQRLPWEQQRGYCIKVRAPPYRSKRSYQPAHLGLG